VGNFATAGIPYGIAIQGNYAYVAYADLIGSGGGLLIVDVSDPANPHEASAISVPAQALDVAVAGHYAYVADSTAGLRVIDVSNPASPHEVGALDTSGDAQGVTIAGSFVYVAAGAQGLRIFSIADPANPQAIGFADTPGNAYAVTVAGTTAYVADDTSGLRVIDVSDPAHAREIGAYNTPGEARSVAVIGSSIYVADQGGGLLVLGPSTPPTTPTPTSTPIPFGITQRYLPLMRKDAPIIETPTPTTTPTPPEPVCDSYELNDSRDSPSSEPLASRQLYQARLCTGDAEDNYVFDTTTTSPVQLTLTLPPKLVGSSAIWVYAKTDTGTTICGTGPVKKAVYSVSCPISASGRYIIRIYNDLKKDDVNFYTLQVNYP
jgi:hypothetical protein